MNQQERNRIKALFCSDFKFSHEISKDFFNCKEQGKELKGEPCRDCAYYKYHGLKAYCYK